MQRSIPILSVVFLLVSGCSSSQSSSAIEPNEDVPCVTSAGESCEEEDFFGELSVDVRSTLPGTWTAEGYSLQGPDESIEVESTLTFAVDGGLSTFSAPPLFDYPEYVYTPPTPGDGHGCVDVVVPDGVAGSTMQGWFLNATMGYEVVETAFNPVVRFTISGQWPNMCCGTYVGACAEQGFEASITDDQATTGFLVIGARENELALLSDGSRFLVVLTRVE